MNKTQFIKALGEKAGLQRRDVLQLLGAIEELVVEELAQYDEGTVVIGDICRIRKVHTPARPAGDYPGFGGEMKTYPKRPAKTSVRVGMPKKMKDQLL